MNQADEAINDSDRVRPLLDLEQDVSPDFMSIVRKKIYRRTTANQVVGFSWNLPKVILMELIMLVAHLIAGSNEKKANKQQSEST